MTTNNSSNIPNQTSDLEKQDEKLQDDEWENYDDEEDYDDEDVPSSATKAYESGNNKTSENDHFTGHSNYNYRTHNSSYPHGEDYGRENRRFKKKAYGDGYKNSRDTNYQQSGYRNNNRKQDYVQSNTQGRDEGTNKREYQNDFINTNSSYAKKPGQSKGDYFNSEPGNSNNQYRDKGNKGGKYKQYNNYPSNNRSSGYNKEEETLSKPIFINSKWGISGKEDNFKALDSVGEDLPKFHLIPQGEIKATGTTKLWDIVYSNTSNKDSKYSDNSSKYVSNTEANTETSSKRRHDFVTEYNASSDSYGKHSFKQDYNKQDDKYNSNNKNYYQASSGQSYNKGYRTGYPMNQPSRYNDFSKTTNTASSNYNSNNKYDNSGYKYKSKNYGNYNKPNQSSSYWGDSNRK